MSLHIQSIPDIPLIHAGDSLAQIIFDASQQAGITLQDGDALVVASKVVSKAEGQFVDLNTVTPSEQALKLTDTTNKDPRIIELVLRESRMVSRASRGVLVTQHRLGFVSANAGIDQSNVGQGDDVVLLLPADPDASAWRLRAALHELTGVWVAIVISDTHGRPFRLGNVGVAIGVAGMSALVDLRGTPDLFGRVMQISVLGYADLVASAAHLVSGEGAEGFPVTLVRGLSYVGDGYDGRAANLNRPPEQDLYR